MNEQSRVDPLATRTLSKTPNLGAGAKPDQLSSGPRSGSGRLEVRCPNCRAPTDVDADTTLTDLTCTTCGSHFSLVDQSKATRMAPALSKLGRFELIERIGVGGFGSVWKALDKELDRTVAIKVPRTAAMTAEEQEKFFREARAAAQLRHPSIVSVHEVGRDGDSVYIVSDFVRGVTLGDWLTGQLLTSREAAELCAKIADALQHAHEQGVIHRDLKPANVMLDGDGEPHLMDFGLARREVGEVTVTMDGQILGTPAYMSPEQALGEAHTADSRSDIYSLGVILFQLLTGELPFRGNARMIMHQVVHEEPPSPRKLNANISKDLETITLKCLEKSPERRFDSAKDLADELRRFLAGEPIRARPIGRFERGLRWIKRNPRVATLTASVAVLLITIAALSMAGYSVAKKQQRAAEEAATREADLRALSEENLNLAEKAVNDYLTRAAADGRLKLDDFHKLRTELLETAVPFYERFAKQKPGDAKTEANRAVAYAQLASIHGETGQSKKSVQEYEQAISLERALLTTHPNMTDVQFALARHYSELGWNLHITGDYDGARPNYHEAVRLLTELVKKSPNHKDYRYELATAHRKTGFLASKSDPALAQTEYESALQLFEPLVKEFPDVADYQNGLAETLFRIGYLLFPDPAMCRDYLTRAADMQRQLVAKSPKNPNYRAPLAESVAYLGGALYNLGDKRGARKQYEEGIQIALSVVTDFPSVKSYRVILRGMARTYVGHLNYFYDGEATPDELNKSLAIVNELIAKFPDPPHDLFWKAWLHDQYANSLERTGNSAAALEQRSLANAGFSHLATLAKDHPGFKGDTLALAHALAWDLATTPKKESQNGARALELATIACELTDYKDFQLFYTLAAAHAQTGDFTKAVDYCEQSIKLLDSKDAANRALADRALALYKNKQPMRPPSADEHGENK